MLLEIENLLRLQEADKAIRRLQDEIAELPKRVAAIEHKPTNLRAANTTPPSRTFAARSPSTATNLST
jgi:predicted  nucleic acid-binding Zn-ribbon protein